jgi:hypothetical protein
MSSINGARRAAEEHRSGRDFPKQAANTGESVRFRGIVDRAKQLFMLA